MDAIERYPGRAEAASSAAPHSPPARPHGVPDCVSFAPAFTPASRTVILAGSVIAGAFGGAALHEAGPASSAALLPGLLAVTAFVGGLLSTWSPCGYSSISLLRPTGQGAAAVLRWMPTFLVHGAGYALGALVLGLLLGGLGGLLGFAGASTLTLSLLAAVGLIYGVHQLDFLRVPYPQRQAQVPHDARQRFGKTTIGGLYGLALGLNYMTYVQTPLLYLVTLAALFSGSVAEALAIFAIFNLGRFLPMAVNMLPLPDHAIQAWLARNQERAAMLDGAILVSLGAALAVWLVL